jgi:hypothetical protein
MQGDVLARDAMTVIKKPLELSSHEIACEQIPQPTERQGILNSIFQETLWGSFRLDAVKMIPMGEGPFDLNVSELFGRLNISVFGYPAAAKRTLAYW